MMTVICFCRVSVQSVFTETDWPEAGSVKRKAEPDDCSRARSRMLHSEHNTMYFAITVAMLILPYCWSRLCTRKWTYFATNCFGKISCYAFVTKLKCRFRIILAILHTPFLVSEISLSRLFAIVAANSGRSKFTAKFT